MLRGWWTWPVLVVGLLACLGAAYGAYALAGYSWSQVVEYETPYAAEPLATDGPPVGAPLASRVVLVIVDGMRDDISRSEMVALDRVRGYGTDAVLRTAEPSLSFPNWTTILSGAPQTISGVTTNWWEGRVRVPTVLDVALDAGRRVGIVGPEDFAELYGVEPGPLVSLRPWPKGGYLSGTLVDDALRIVEDYEPDLLVLHLPDLDEAGHDYGGGSRQYAQVARRIDADLGRLFSAIQSETTAFVVVSDHGHIDSGGHGGWEPEVNQVPLIVSGAGARLAQQTAGTQDQVASTVAVLAGLRPPPFARGGALRSALVTDAATVFAADDAQRIRLLDRMATVIGGGGLSREQMVSVAEAEKGVAARTTLRMAMERISRQRDALLLLAGACVVVFLLAVASWRALVAALAGCIAYYAVYNLLFFVAHGYAWSLSAFNTESNLDAFFNVRMAETVLAGLVATAVASLVYPFFRRFPKGPRERGYLAGWLALSPATVLVIMATLAVQVAWFVWVSGPTIVWTLPDFKWAFKYDLDLVQVTALGAAAVLGMVVSYVVGRYHPRVRAAAAVMVRTPREDTPER